MSETRPPDYYEWHCSRCGDEYPRDREDNVCEECVKDMQWKKIHEGVPCDHCDGHGRVYSDPMCDLQRANGRTEICGYCGGNGRTAWEPDDLDDVHPDLRAEVAHLVE